MFQHDICAGVKSVQTIVIEWKSLSLRKCMMEIFECCKLPKEGNHSRCLFIFGFLWFDSLQGDWQSMLEGRSIWYCAVKRWWQLGGDYQRSCEWFRTIFDTLWIGEKWQKIFNLPRGDDGTGWANVSYVLRRSFGGTPFAKPCVFLLGESCVPHPFWFFCWSNAFSSICEGGHCSMKLGLGNSHY